MKGEDLVKHINWMKLRWLDQVERMQEGIITKHQLHGHIIGLGKKRRPRKRWLQDVEHDIGRIGIRGWKRKAEERIE